MNITYSVCDMDYILCSYNEARENVIKIMRENILTVLYCTDRKKSMYKWIRAFLTCDVQGSTV